MIEGVRMGDLEKGPGGEQAEARTGESSSRDYDISCEHLHLPSKITSP